ncbi:hypothetical protein C4573_03570 [Candidatus Woesearchaeota archaeon]|nr:MAG: hypothetical protein C4573_03570 [Candidatus Woesearchaeota archaeon]
MKSLLIGTLVTALAATANAGNVQIETRADYKEKIEMQRIRTKAITDHVTFTLDQNFTQATKKKDEYKAWLSGKAKNTYVGFVIQGDCNVVDSMDHRRTDIGLFVSQPVGNTAYEGFIATIVKDGKKPMLFYQTAVRAKADIVGTIVQDNNIPVTLHNLDATLYATWNNNPAIAGLGVFHSLGNMEKVYGGLGYNDSTNTGLAVFNYQLSEKCLELDARLGHGNPSGIVSKATMNYWNELNGVGIRKVGQPYTKSFLMDADATARLYLLDDSYEAMVGKKFGDFRIGMGIADDHIAMHTATSFNIGKGTLYVEGRLKESESRVYVQYQQGW